MVVLEFKKEMPAKKLQDPKYKHRHYKRWVAMVQRCYNPKSPHVPERRAAGIGIDEEWHPDNVHALDNYSAWIDKQLLLQPEMAELEFRVSRRDPNKNYGPSNCVLKTHDKIIHTRVSCVLDEDTVVKIRQHKKANPNVTLAELSHIFNQHFVNISRCLTGATWSCVNEREAPVPKNMVRDNKEQVACLTNS